MTVITLPWPPPSLSPNAREHWAAVSRAKRDYKVLCWLALRDQRIERLDHHPIIIPMEVRFHPPRKGRIDADNCLARMKAGLDRLAQHLGVDDSTFRPVPVIGEPVKGGAVVVTIGEGTA